MADYAALIRPTWFNVAHTMHPQAIFYTASDSDVKLKSRTRIAGINNW